MLSWIVGGLSVLFALAGLYMFWLAYQQDASVSSIDNDDTMDYEPVDVFETVVANSATSGDFTRGAFKAQPFNTAEDGLASTNQDSPIPVSPTNVTLAVAPDSNDKVAADTLPATEYVKALDTEIFAGFDDAVLQQNATVQTPPAPSMAGTPAINSVVEPQGQAEVNSTSKSWTNKMASIDLDDLNILQVDDVPTPVIEKPASGLKDLTFDNLVAFELDTPKQNPDVSKTQAMPTLEFALPTELGMPVDSQNTNDLTLADKQPAVSPVDAVFNTALQSSAPTLAASSSLDLSLEEPSTTKPNLIATEEFKIVRAKTSTTSTLSLADVQLTGVHNVVPDVASSARVNYTRTIQALGADEIDGFFDNNDNNPTLLQDAQPTSATVASNLLKDLMVDFPDILNNNHVMEQISLARQYVALGDSNSAVDMLKQIIEASDSSAEKEAALEALQEITG